MPRQRKKKGRAISGWLVLDKPLHLGSTQAVSKVRWLFNAQKAGHAGTLDPLATGILPIALGEATKTVPYVVDGTKAYRFTVKWGERTTTDDLEGEVISSSPKRPIRKCVEELLPSFTGVIKQVPPQFSAIKIDGKRAYDIARAGDMATLEAREVEIDEIKILKHDDETTEFEVECGKGTYVRSIARDMGNQLGCNGHIIKLRRTFVEPFDEQDAVSLSELEALVKDDAEEGTDPRDIASSALDEFLLDAGEAMSGYPQIVMSDEQARRIHLGNSVLLRGRDAPIAEPEACAFHQGAMIAIGKIEAGQFHPKRVLKG
ncbi:MAG: tRNA pseudouridine(55) synthase TruB [Pseudomonadota bacterium]